MYHFLILANSKSGPSFWRAVFSAMAAAFGVQSSKNHHHDAGQTSVLPYVVAGLLFTGVFIFTLIFIVSLVLGKAAG